MNSLRSITAGKSPLGLVRPDLRGFAGYESAGSTAARAVIWLNANESAWASGADEDGQCRRYPCPAATDLREGLARLYGCGPEQVLPTRGSDEAIDLLVRVLCRPGRDGVLVTPPVFGMYAVAARLQGAPLLEVPLLDGPGGFRLDAAASLDTAHEREARLLFLCSPSNPTGQAIPLATISALAAALEGQALVVVDEAYAEYSQAPSAAGLLSRHPNLAVLRTLSKAHALAGARVGALLADAALIQVLRACQAPYPLPEPSLRLAIEAMQPAALERTRAHIATALTLRAELSAALSGLPGVRRVYASEGNFLLVRFADAAGALARLQAAGIAVRDQRAQPQLADALRITVGTREQNRRLLAALARN